MSKMSESRTHFQERLWPAPTLFVALLMILPAVTLAVTPVNVDLAIPIAVGVYVAVNATLILGAPKITVTGTELAAGSAKIPLKFLGTIETLDAEALRAAIGPGLDARAYLLIRGYIHRGVKVQNIDPKDPAPYWVLTSRKPAELAQAIAQAQAAKRA